MTAIEELKALQGQAVLEETKAAMQAQIDKIESDEKSLLARIEAYFANAEGDVQAWWAKAKAKL